MARYRVEEELARFGRGEAVGESSDVSGAIVFRVDGSVDPDRSRIMIDLRTLRSNEARRDNFLRTRSLESNRFPIAEFVVRDAPGLTLPLPQSGEVIFQLEGDMTLHGETRPLEWDAIAQFGTTSAIGQVRTSFTFATFGMSKPSLIFIISVEDEIRLEVDYVGTVEVGS